VSHQKFIHPPAMALTDQIRQVPAGDGPKAGPRLGDATQRHGRIGGPIFSLGIDVAESAIKT
jgi:hypothetical protein